MSQPGDMDVLTSAEESYEDDDDISISDLSDGDVAEEVSELYKDHDESIDALLARYGRGDKDTLVIVRRRSEDGSEADSSVCDIRQLLDGQSCVDDENDVDFEPKPIVYPSSRVGPEYQADLAVVNLPNVDRPFDELFSFTEADSDELRDLTSAYTDLLTMRAHPIPRGNLTRLLTLYWKFNRNKEETLAFLKDEIDKYYPDDKEYTDLQLAMYPLHPDRPWSVDEIHALESGLRTYGKLFETIQFQMLPGRSLRDILDLYYQFKATESYNQIMAEQKCIAESTHGYLSRPGFSGSTSGGHNYAAAKYPFQSLETAIETEQATRDVSCDGFQLNGSKVVQGASGLALVEWIDNGVDVEDP